MKRTFRGIVKVQRPLFHSGGDMNELLIYNKDRSIETLMSVDEGIMRELFPNDELKTYWLAEGEDGGMLNFLERVEDKEW